MKKISFLYDEFEDACAELGMTPTVWMKSNGFSSATSTALKSCLRPALETMHNLVSKFDDRTVRWKLIRGYLMDEIDRIDAPDLSQADFSIDSTGNEDLNDSPEMLSEDLRVIQQFMKHRSIRRSMHGLAVLLKRSEWAQEDGLYADASDTVAQAERDAAMQKLTATKRRTKQQGEQSA